MAEQIIIEVTRSTDQKSFTIVDKTDWSIVSGTIDSLTDIDINLYTTDLDTPDDTYRLTQDQEDAYTANGEITLTFLETFGSEYITDSWYNILMSATDGDYVSNYDGFGIYISAINTVYENVNNLYTPEKAKLVMENLYWQHMCVSGLNWLDLSTEASRDIKFNKRLRFIQKINS